MNKSVIKMARSKKRRVAILLCSLKDKCVAAIDNSYVAFIGQKLRGYLPNMRNKSLGVFIVTFGIYGALISAFRYMFDFGAEKADVVFSGAIILLGIPFLFSQEKIADLISSYTGEVISRYVGIRADAVSESSAVGRANMAFLLGSVVGALTFVLPPSAVISFILCIVVLATVLVYPEASVVIGVVTLPFGMKLFSVVVAMGAVSLLIKAFRGKRSLNFCFHDKACAAFYILLVFGSIVGGRVEYGLMALSCFILSLPKGAGARAEKATAAFVASCGFAVALQLGLALGFMLSDKSLSFAEASRAVGLFDLGELAYLCAAAVPLAVSHSVKNTSLSTLTSYLCLLVTVGYLIVSGYLFQFAVAAVAVMLLIIYYNRKVAYGILALLLVAFFMWLNYGGSERDALHIISVVVEKSGMSAPAVTHNSIVEYICGVGVGAGFAEADNLPGAVIYAMGIAGAVLLSVYVLGETVFVLRYGTDFSQKKDSIYITNLAPLCSAAVLTVCGMSYNIFEFESVFALMWLLFGAASAITKSAKAKKDYQSQQFAEDNGIANASVVIEMSKLRQKGV